MASVKKLKVNKWKGRNRLEGLKKKFGQLTTLCDVDGFLVCVDSRDPSSLSSSCSPPLFPDYFWPEDRTKFCSLIDRYYQQTVGLSGSLGKKRKRNCTGTQLGRLCENDRENEEEGFERKSTSKKLKKSEEIETGFLDHLNQDGVFVVDAVKHEDLESLLSEIRKRKTTVKERIEYLKGETSDARIVCQLFDKYDGFP